MFSTVKRTRWIALLALGLLAGCYTVPETGRSSLIIPMVVGDEVAQGATAFAEMKSKEKLSSNPLYNEQVQRVGQRISQAVGSDLPAAKWEFVVFDEPKTVNAFALPGGKVGVYSGLLRLVASDDEIAIVMGHEIAHVTARHGAERATTGAMAGWAGLILGTATHGSTNSDLILAAYGGAVAGGVLTFSRAHESEADHIGLHYAAKAGYDPRAAITFWQKMAKEAAGSNTPLLLRTHPTTEHRISDLQRWMPEAIPLYEAARKKYE